MSAKKPWASEWGTGGRFLSIPFSARPGEGTALTWPEIELQRGAGEPPLPLPLESISLYGKMPDGSVNGRLDPAADPPDGWWLHPSMSAGIRLPDDVPAGADYRVKLTVRDLTGQTAETVSEPFALLAQGEEPARREREAKKEASLKPINDLMIGAAIWAGIGVISFFISGNLIILGLAIVAFVILLFVRSARAGA